MTYTKEQHQKWLEKQGLSLKQIKERKPKKKSYRTNTNYASSYYEEKSLDGRSMIKKENNFANENENIKKEIERKKNLMLAMNMPGPRDLDYSVGSIDQKYLQGK